MRVCKDWKNYSLIATNNGEKLEEWGPYTLLRPDPQVIWNRSEVALEKTLSLHAHYKRSSTGGGQWETFKKMKDEWTINWKDLTFSVKLMGFKHTGIFPEQAYNWERMMQKIASAGKQIKVLNLFGYTGGASVACAKAGAQVTHVDASKGMCERLRENMKLSNLQDSPVRTIVDDCEKFVEREIRRGNKYDAIIMDPPSYGRGPKGEIWKIEEKIYDFVKLTSQVLTDQPLFVLINSYTTGLQPQVMKNISQLAFKSLFKNFDSYEIGIEGKDGIVLPCGASCFSEN